VLLVARSFVTSDELMRVLMENVAVFECAWLRFIAVADQIDGLGVVRRNECPLHAGGESCSATTPEAGFFDFLGDVLWCHSDGFFQLLVAAVAEIAIDGRIVIRAIDIFENQAILTGMRLFSGKVGDHICS
jgi:hypothetical protein